MDSNRKQIMLAVAAGVMLLGSMVVVVVMNGTPSPKPVDGTGGTSGGGGVVVGTPGAKAFGGEKLPLLDPKVHAAEGQRLARQGKLAEAVAQYQMAIEGEPNQHWYWYLTGCLLAEMGDANAHRDHCRRMLEKFGSAPESYIVERISRATLLLPQAEADVSAAQVMLDGMLRKNIPPTQLPWVQLAKGMAEYRAGRFAQSVEWFTQARDGAGMTYASGKIMADLYLAMAYSQLGDIKMARKSMSAAQNRIERQMPALNQNGVGGDNDQWLNINVARREARSALDRNEPGTVRQARK